MKTHLKPQLLPMFAVGMGTAAMILRFCVYALTTDEKGLLIAGHPLQLALWLVTAAAAGAILLALRPLEGSCRYEDNFPASPVSAAGCFLLAAGICVTVFQQGLDLTRMALLRTCTGILAAAALIPMGLCRRKGSRPGFGFPAMVCLFLTVHTVSSYPGWSSRPQLLDSLFALLGCVTLMVFSYQQTAFCVGLARRRVTIGAGLLAVVTCMAAIPGSGTFLLYLTGALWALTNLCCLEPPAAQPARKE